MAFLDTELTNFDHPQLLSVGMVTADGSEFYAELDRDSELGRAVPSPMRALRAVYLALQPAARLSGRTPDDNA